MRARPEGKWNERDFIWEMYVDCFYFCVRIGSTLVMDDVVQMRMNQLEQHVGSLENRLRGEEDRRQALEDEIRRLREANSRLAGESQTAAQQLKRFTDWFFQTIERPWKITDYLIQIWRP